MPMCGTAADGDGGGEATGAVHRPRAGRHPLDTRRAAILARLAPGARVVAVAANSVGRRRPLQLVRAQRRADRCGPGGRWVAAARTARTVGRSHRCGRLGGPAPAPLPPGARRMAQRLRRRRLRLAVRLHCPPRVPGRVRAPLPHVAVGRPRREPVAGTTAGSTRRAVRRHRRTGPYRAATTRRWHRRRRHRSWATPPSRPPLPAK
jgi:hypothetical protein